MSLAEVVKTVLDQMQYVAKTQTVIGDPIRAGDLILIPVSKVSIGFAAGGTDSEKKAGSGAGTGGGIQVTPVAFVSVCGDKIQVHPMEKSDPTLSKIVGMAPEIMKKVSQFMNKDQKSAKGESRQEAKKDK